MEDDPFENMIPDTNCPLTKYAMANQPKIKRTKKTNDRPEKDLERLVMAWLDLNKFDCNVVEAKAAYNPKIKRYLGGPTIPGFSDIVGNTKDGIAVFIELKAPGKLSTISFDQYTFLKRKILHGCFATCVDSVDMLSTIYKNWNEFSEFVKKDYLLSKLKGDKYADI